MLKNKSPNDEYNSWILSNKNWGKTGASFMKTPQKVEIDHSKNFFKNSLN